MPFDQPGSLLSLRLVRIPRLRRDNDAHHFLSSHQDSPIQADAAALGRPSQGGNGFGITREEMRGLYRRLQTGRGQPLVDVRGDIKLTKFFQKLVPRRSRSNPVCLGFKALLFFCEAFVQRWGFVEKPSHICSFQVLGGSAIGTLSHRCKPKGSAVMHARGALCAQVSI